MALSLAGKLKWPKGKISDLAFQLVEDLKGIERYKEAARIHLEYLDDLEEAILLLTKEK